MTITDEELANLPDDLEEKFVALVALAQRYEKAAVGLTNEAATTRHKAKYLDVVMAAADVCGIEPMTKRHNYPSSDTQIEQIYRAVKRDAESLCTYFRIRNAARLKPNSVKLEIGAKEKLRHHLDQIRKAVDESNLPDAKKERLYDRISKLGLEIDKDRTPMEALGGLMAEFATATEPLIEKAQELARIFGYAKEQEDTTARLPAPKKPKQIEHKPEQQQPSPKASNGADDKTPI